MAVTTDGNCSRNCFKPVMCGLFAASVGGGLSYGASQVVEYLQKDVCKAIFDPSCVKGICLNNALEDCRDRFSLVPVFTYALGGALSIFLALSTSFTVRQYAKRKNEPLLFYGERQVETTYAKRFGMASALSLLGTGAVAFGLSIAFQGNACDSTCKVVNCSFDDRCVEWMTYSCAHDCKSLSTVIMSACIPIFLSLAIAIPYGYLNYKHAIA